uniref:Uncharacterized protein n=1 Tax=Ackermannviridae sp. ctaCq7 TaxID=2827294 RepID=A0A8S5R5J1_9CAUD|nr:MAG TPA: hypothetical protein [Ackermannviridae sp. ctaCq7]
MNKDNIIKVSIFIICSFLVSILVWLPIYLTTAILLAYIGMLLDSINFISKNTLIAYLLSVSKIVSIIISVYIGISLSKLILKDE